MINWLIARCDELRVGFMFLSRLPVGQVDRRIEIAATAWSWPIVGAVIGVIFGATYKAAVSLGLQIDVAVVVAMIAGLISSGGLHEDGLADLADGVGGGSDVARRLAIMRDSRLGSYGAMALIFAFLMAFLLWKSVDVQAVLSLAVALGAGSRLALPLWLRLFRAARADGLGAAAARSMPWRNVLAALLFGGILALVYMPISMLAGCLAAQLVVCLYARYSLGGVSGDVMGAAQVVGVIVGLLAGYGG